MCTAVYLSGAHSSFGRNLDLDHHYNECIAVAPRGFTVKAKNGSESAIRAEFSITGVATMLDNYPLYYDAVNEWGLAMAGLNFTASASYSEIHRSDMVNLAPYELIPYVLSQCRSVTEARDVLMRVNLTADPPSKSLGTARLHFILADKHRAITAEPCDGKLKIYDNPVGVLTNEPPFDFHMHNLSLYERLSPTAAEQSICEPCRLALHRFTGGTGAFGLPGDTTSPSRFIRAAFGVLNTPPPKNDEDAALSVFHVLDTVKVIEGSQISGGTYHKTVYTSAVNLNTGTYYIKTYKGQRICAYRPPISALFASEVTVFPIEWEKDIKYIVDK